MINMPKGIICDRKITLYTENPEYIKEMFIIDRHWETPKMEIYKRLAKTHNCSISTVRKYLKKLGVI